jgi:hypothetical protein
MPCRLQYRKTEQLQLAWRRPVPTFDRPPLDLLDLGPQPRQLDLDEFELLALIVGVGTHTVCVLGGLHSPPARCDGGWRAIRSRPQTGNARPPSGGCQGVRVGTTRARSRSIGCDELNRPAARTACAGSSSVFNHSTSRVRRRYRPLPVPLRSRFPSEAGCPQKEARDARHSSQSRGPLCP